MHARTLGLTSVSGTSKTSAGSLPAPQPALWTPPCAGRTLSTPGALPGPHAPVVGRRSRLCLLRLQPCARQQPPHAAPSVTAECAGWQDTSSSVPPESCTSTDLAGVPRPATRAASCSWVAGLSTGAGTAGTLARPMWDAARPGATARRWSLESARACDSASYAPLMAAEARVASRPGLTSGCASRMAAR